MGGTPDAPGGAPVARGRCRCAHFPTQHMLTKPVGTSSNFRLEPSGPCAVCGEAGCRSYVPESGSAVTR